MNETTSKNKKTRKKRKKGNANCNSTNGIINEENDGRTRSSNTTGDTNGPCIYCLQMPCVVLTYQPRPRGPPSPTNHTRRPKEYRYFYRILKTLGLWQMEEYLTHKQELGCHINDIREVMPDCVVYNVRARWPNPPHIPYMGHKRA